METVTSLSIAQDGRVADCRTVRMSQSPELGMEAISPCEIERPGGQPYFESSGEAVPRRARMRTAIFFK